MTEPAANSDRRILLLAHTGREDAREVARAVVSALSVHGLIVRTRWWGSPRLPPAGAGAHGR